MGDCVAFGGQVLISFHGWRERNHSFGRRVWAAWVRGMEVGGHGWSRRVGEGPYFDTRIYYRTPIALPYVHKVHEVQLATVPMHARAYKVQPATVWIHVRAYKVQLMRTTHRRIVYHRDFNGVPILVSLQAVPFKRATYNKVFEAFEPIVAARLSTSKRWRVVP